MSPGGLCVWLGDGIGAPLEKGAVYKTADGTVGEIRSLRPGDRIRLTWRPAGRDGHATVQVAVRAAKSGCSVRFHTEHLNSEQERSRMRDHWRNVLDRLERALSAR